MVYESDFYTTRRPYSRPTISSYSITRLGDANEWDSPYSWPVRREFSRILHRPRPHVGIIYTERFLNSRPLTYFDDETKFIRAKAGAILKQLHSPQLKPSTLRLPYHSLDLHRAPYGVPQHIYHQSFFNEPAHSTIGRGHLACVQYAGGKSYPRRKNLCLDENRNIRDEIKFRSYYNRTKHDDPNTLPTGFAWRLLHLPPKDDKPFTIYRHSRTLHNLDFVENKSDKEKENGNEKTQKPSYKRYQKRYTEPVEETAIPEKTKESTAVKSHSDYTSEPISQKKKTEIDVTDSYKKQNEEPENLTSIKEHNQKEEIGEVNVQNKEAEKKKKKKKDEDIPENTSVNPNLGKAEEEEVSGKKKMKKDEDISENTFIKPNLNTTQPLIQEETSIPEPNLSEPLEKEIPNSQVKAEEEIMESVPEVVSPAEQNELPPEENVIDNTLAVESQLGTTDKDPEIEIEKVEEALQPEDVGPSSNSPEISKETDSNEIETNQIAPSTETIKSESDEIFNKTTESTNQSLETPEATPEEVEQEKEIIDESREVLDTETIVKEVESENVVSDDPQEEASITNPHEDESNPIIDLAETETVLVKDQNMLEDDTSETNIHEHEQSEMIISSQIQNEISEVSYTETHNVSSTREETVIQEVDITAQEATDVLAITEELESSQDALNNGEQITDEENIEIQE